MKKIYLLLFLLLTACGQATKISPPEEPTQPPIDTKVPPTETPEPTATLCTDFSIFSDKVKDDISIQIALPEEYNDFPDREYNSIYLLDANYFFSETGTLDNLMERGEGMTKIVQNLTQNGQIPPSILIGIGYTEAQRGRFTMGGQVPSFYEFFADELIPEIESKCRVSKSAKDRVLLGYSGSAHFAIYVLMYDAYTGSEIFDKFISISGVYDRYQVVYALAEEIFQGSDKNIFAGKSLFIAVGADEPSPKLLNYHRAFTEKLTSEGYTDFRLYSTEFPGKGHYDIPEFAFAEGMIWMFGE